MGVNVAVVLFVGILASGIVDFVLEAVDFLNGSRQLEVA